jgi:hypothetical protein
MKIFVFHFKVKPEQGYHMTIKHGYAGVYVRAKNLAAASTAAREYVTSHHWIVSSVVADGVVFNSEIHDLADEALSLYHKARQTGAAMGIAAVGFDANADGSHN